MPILTESFEVPLKRYNDRLPAVTLIGEATNIPGEKYSDKGYVKFSFTQSSTIFKELFDRYPVSAHQELFEDITWVVFEAIEEKFKVALDSMEFNIAFGAGGYWMPSSENYFEWFYECDYEYLEYEKSY